jgi:hypothetical protein
MTVYLIHVRRLLRIDDLRTLERAARQLAIVEPDESNEAHDAAIKSGIDGDGVLAELAVEHLALDAISKADPQAPTS